MFLLDIFFAGIWVVKLKPIHFSGCLNVTDPYHQIDKFDYVDASPVEEALDAVNAATNGCPPYAMAPPLPPRTGASPTGNRGPMITSVDERMRVSHKSPSIDFCEPSNGLHRVLPKSGFKVA